MQIKTAKDLDELKKKGNETLYPGKIKLMVGSATCGIANGANETTLELINAAQSAGLDASVETTGCIGICHMEPLVDVWIPGHPRLMYKQITSKKAEALVKSLKEGTVKENWVLYRMENEPLVVFNDTVKYDISAGNGQYGNLPLINEVPFFQKQNKIALRNTGYVDPTSIEEYIARGGFYALQKVLTGMSPDDVVNAIKESGLRGRGGGGFLTGRKWASCRKVQGDEKYIICNGDEGDPGAYMDRSILEGDPYSVIEGLIIGAYAVGNIRTGYIYVRNEYPRAIQMLEMAIDTLREYGLLGNNIMGSDLSFDIKISQGAGAFVCGESTALMASIEGRRGDPRAKYVHTVESGLFGKPTVLNNVETLANVPAIVYRGADWYKSIGTPSNTGTKAFALVGNIKNTGLIEVPMGITLKEVIYDIGGGIAKDKGFKAVQTGGPSGGCIPESLLDMPVNFDDLTKVGSMMGSGGMIVMDKDTCMVDVARYFLDFLAEESCGKCTPCREGIRVMLDILKRITKGEGKEGDIEMLEDMGKDIQRSALCGLGQTAPNPLLSTIKYFRDEYDAHIKDKKCPGGICKALITYSIDADKCTGCTLCAKVCPESCITGETKKVHRIDAGKCIKCNACFEACNFDAVKRT